jgi:tripeptide aminopeptidase
MTDLTGRADVEVAVRHIRETDEDTLSAQIALSEIPAPSFDEVARGEYMAALMAQTGLDDTRVDRAGNVLASRPGSDRAAPALVISAHLDTVFPAGTDVTVAREGDVLRGPGISDDARGLTTMLAVARALDAAAIRTRTPLLFAATVGEEGIGDLRGVKHLFGDTGEAADAAGFISLDGAGLDRIVTRGLGSRRYRISVTGPGGHSWVDWGTPNPIHHLAALANTLALLELSDNPVSTLTIARIGGGKSINAIPQSAWLEIDTRCADSDVLARMESSIRNIVREATPPGRGMELDITVIGDRPGAGTDLESSLVRATLAATLAVGREPILALSSTDANVPMNAGIPALTIGCGGEAGLAHTTEEWYRNVHGPEGVIRALYVVLLTAGIVDPS